MKIFNCPQGSEAWEHLRRGKATASEFDRIVTPAKLQFAAGAYGYACQKVAEILGVESPQPPPSYWMERGTELEQYARQEFESYIGQKVIAVGFCQPIDNPRVGCSPDGLVGDNGVLEIKCPSAEKMIEYLADGGLPKEYKMQVQGELWVTGREVCHFWVWHPELEPLPVLVTRDQEVMDALDEHIPKFLELVDSLMLKVTKRTPPRMMTEYESVEVDL